MQNLRYAITAAIERGSYSDPRDEVAHARGELAKYVSGLEARRPVPQMNFETSMLTGQYDWLKQEYQSLNLRVAVLETKAATPRRAVAKNQEESSMNRMIKLFQSKANVAYEKYLKCREDASHILKPDRSPEWQSQFTQRAKLTARNELLAGHFAASSHPQGGTQPIARKPLSWNLSNLITTKPLEPFYNDPRRRLATSPTRTRMSLANA